MITVIITIFLAGCSSSTPPHADLRTGGESIPVVQGSYCWKDECVDKIEASKLLEQHQYSTPEATPNSTVRISYATQPIEKTTVKLIGEENVTEVNVQDETFTLPNEHGTYTYLLETRWEQGSSSYVFQIKIK